MKRISIIIVLLHMFLLGGIQIGWTQNNDLQSTYNILNTSIDSLFSLGQYENAIPLKIKAVELSKANDSLYAYSIHTLARLYALTAKNQKVEELYQDALKLRLTLFGELHQDCATSYNDLALFYRNMGRYEEAEEMYLKCISIRKKLGQGKMQDYAIVLNNLATVYQMTDRLEEAKELYLESRQILEESDGKKNNLYIITVNNLGYLYMKMQKYATAEPYLLETEKLIKELLGSQHPNYAIAINNLASLYQFKGAYKKALPYNQETLKLNKKLYGKEHPNYAVALNNIAVLYSKLKAYDKSIPLKKEAYNLFLKLYPNEGHPQQLRVLNNIASDYLEQDSLEIAMFYYGQSIRQNTKLEKEKILTEDWVNGIKNRPGAYNVYLLNSLKGCFEVYKKKNDLEKQKQLADIAIYILGQQKNKIGIYKDKIKVLEQANAWISERISLFDPEADAVEAFAIAEMSKSVLLMESVQAEQAYQLGTLPDSLWQKEKQLGKEQSKLEASVKENIALETEDSLRTALNELNLKINKFSKELMAKYPKYYKLKYQQNSIQLKEIQAELNDDQALIEYIWAEQTIFCFVLKKNSCKMYDLKLNADSLLSKIQQMHSLLSDYNLLGKKSELALESYKVLGNWFYEGLVRSFEAEIQDVSQLIIIADQNLGHLPFESFLIKPTKGDTYKELDYLLKHYSVSYNYSATLWKDNKEAKKKKNNGELLAMVANYNTKLGTDSLLNRSFSVRQVRDVLEPLPAARKEVETLQELYRGYFAFDTLASEKEFQAKASKYAIIHLAMHGLLNEQNPILSSLAFTEDGDSLEDNFLQAHEISKMELNTDLVVLSACETGYGRFETGNGIASLARAFMYAGVPSLVVSLWQVNDLSTSIIMQNFYKHLANGKTKSAALRQAKLDYIEQADGLAAHPVFWSPFILIGDESPVKLQRKGVGNWLWWALGAGAFLIAGLGFGLSRRKKAA